MKALEETFRLKEKDRNVALDVLKFMAAFMITNCHLGPMYGKYAILATGGWIGDSLFFFCSGFALFLRPIGGGNFFNWYKRRINRIYPSIIATAFLACLFFRVVWSVVDIATASHFWFIYCIMAYYIVIYFVGKYMPYKMLHLVAIVCAITAVWWFFLSDKPGATLYNGHPIRWLHSISYMLIGAFLSMKRNEIKPGKSIKDIVLLVILVALFYGIFVVSQKLNGPLALIQYISMFPLFVAMLYFYKVASSEWVARLYKNKVVHFIVRVIGGLCLEIYLVQAFFISDKYNSLFPLNIVGVFLVIFIVAYLTRCFARLISQTFNDAPYNWGKIISQY